MLVRLNEVESRRLVEGTLAPMTMEHVTRAKQTWVAEFERRQNLSLRDEDSMVWTRGLMSDLSVTDSLPPRGYVVLQGGEVQGIVVFDEELCPSLRMPGTWVLYLKYLATAPWNRWNGADSGRFRHVGRILVAQSVRESISRGCPGRIGLHSYPAASPFYEKLCFDKRGSDALRRGMCYFELSPGTAFLLLSDFGTPTETSFEFPIASFGQETDSSALL